MKMDFLRLGFKDHLYILCSFVLVSFAQSAWVSQFCIAAAALGYAVFWRAMLKIPTNKGRFWLSVAWFSGVQAIQLFWFTSTDYMGPFILIVYVFLIFAIGIQFGVLSFFFDEKKIGLRNCFALAGCWVILEWSRLFFLTGFTWNPVGLALADSSYAIQFAAVFGVYGLSFWVMFVNAFGLYSSVLFSWRRCASWVLLAAFPYLFGVCQQTWVKTKNSLEKELSVALVQTAILPEQKDSFICGKEMFIPPLQQWERIWMHLKKEKQVDLIVLPEAAVTLGARRPFYPIEIVKEAWETRFGKDSLKDFPSVGKHIKKVTNGFIAQAVANHFKADVIVGFDDQDGALQYNAAFHFRHQESKVARYEKRILVPMGEYVPLTGIRWISDFLAERFGISGAFEVGSDVKLFSSFGVPVGVSICLEETYSGLIRDLRLKGAELFVNVSNDGWFPKSRLPWQHFQHGRLRSAENGVCSLRACNTGITGGIDCFGRILEILVPSEQEVGVLYLSFPLWSFHTLYTWWGDGAILICSALCVLFALLIVVAKMLIPAGVSAH